VIAAIAMMKPSAPTAEAAGINAAAIREGLRFLKAKPALQSTFWIDLNAMIFGLPESLFPAVALTRLGGGPRLLGLLYAAPAAGSLAASLASGRARHVVRQGRATLVAVACWGARSSDSA
jgi:hypothetical protein